MSGSPHWLRFIAVITAGSLLLSSGAAAMSASQAGAWIAQVYATGPVDNPLKGLVPFAGTWPNFPHSMEWKYIAWKDIQTGPSRFQWEPIDRLLADVAARGHHAIFRIYADYPNQPYAVPAFLSDVPRRSYTDHGNGGRFMSYSPDYDDPRLERAMLDTIKALGRRYDGDARIAFITIGFVGFFGEWQTYRPGCACDDWMPSRKTQSKIITTFVKAFPRTRILARYPDVGWTGQDVGFHDDSFADHTIDPPAWTFLGRMKAAKATRQWQTQPIGGELAPRVQSCAFSAVPCTADGQDFDTSVRRTHATWLLNHYAFERGYAESDYQRAESAARRMGYDFFVSWVRHGDTTADDRLQVEVRIQNRGVAPFYYNWPVQLGVASAGRLLATFDTDWEISRVIGDEADAAEVTFKHVQRRHGLEPGRYSLLLRVVNPLPTGRALAFSNQKWGLDLPGWLTLGAFTVRSR